MQNSNQVKRTYVIEQLAGKMIKNGVTYYKVQWSDLHPDTWEPKKNFVNCQALFDKYEKEASGDIGHIEGNILFDKPIEIVGFCPKNNNRDIAFYVKWDQRPDGTIPDVSICYREEIKKRFPLLLIKFYEKHLIL